MRKLVSSIMLGFGLLWGNKFGSEIVIGKCIKPEGICMQPQKISPLELYLLEKIKQPFCEKNEIKKKEIKFYENAYNFEIDDKFLYETPADIKLLESRINLNDKDFLLAVDKSRHLIFLYQVRSENSCPNEYELIQIFPASNGRKYKETPSGLFKLSHKEKAFLRFKDYKMGKYAYNLIEINSNGNWSDYKIHGTNEPNLIGKGNYSHGCIRLFDSDIIKLTENKYLKKGTIVFITDKLNF